MWGLREYWRDGEQLLREGRASPTGYRLMVNILARVSAGARRSRIGWRSSRGSGS
ncbi:MAG: hypothetical protein PHU34_04195 [Candidatus Methanoperedens sp.]|nr:hypothetical protein [Candidatus Methanoperedens sp.]